MSRRRRRERRKKVRRSEEELKRIYYPKLLGTTSVEAEKYRQRRQGATSRVRTASIKTRTQTLERIIKIFSPSKAARRIVQKTVCQRNRSARRHQLFKMKNSGGTSKPARRRQHKC